MVIKNSKISGNLDCNSGLAAPPKLAAFRTLHYHVIRIYAKKDKGNLITLSGEMHSMMMTISSTEHRVETKL